MILYYNNDIILKETIEGKDVLEKSIGLSENKASEYTVVILNDGRQYIKNFNIYKK